MAGGAAYDPEMMLGVLIYAYCVGERSGRRIEQRLVEDVAFRVVGANQQPDHATIARFRATHETAIAGVFGQVLALCSRAGLLRPGLIAIDGTKLNANASRDANRTAAQIAEEILAEAAAADAAEDATAAEEETGPEDEFRNVVVVGPGFAYCWTNSRPKQRTSHMRRIWPSARRSRLPPESRSGVAGRCRPRRPIGHAEKPT
jgi:hypothetical protein